MNKTLSQKDKNEILELLIKLIQIPSVNTLKHGEIPEAKIAKFIMKYLQNIGIICENLATNENRPNIIGRWEGNSQNSDKPLLTLNAHMDTVNVEGMTIDPFKAEIIDNKIYGRGACDTKASLAIFLWLMKKISNISDKNKLTRRIEFLATSDEENYCGGSRYLVENGYKADEMIIGEPTNCQIAIAHRGLMIIKLIAKGACAHASVPDNGENAIYKIVDAISKLRANWIPKLAREKHKILGHTTSAVTIISGGQRVNIIPDSSYALLDTRILPNQNPNQIIDSLKQTIGDLCEIECLTNQPALQTDENIPFVKQLLSICKSVTGEGTPIGLPYLTDACQFAQTGAKCVIFGPGKIEQAHSADEYLEIEQLYKSADILLKFLIAE